MVPCFGEKGIAPKGTGPGGWPMPKAWVRLPCERERAGDSPRPAFVFGLCERGGVIAPCLQYARRLRNLAHNALGLYGMLLSHPSRSLPSRATKNLSGWKVAKSL